MTVTDELLPGPDPVDPIRDIDLDMDADDSLLGLPARALLNLRAVRGLVLLALALVLLLWPERTDRVLGVLLGIGLTLYVATRAITLVRHPAQRRFLPLLTVAIGGGFAVALTLHPADSLTSVAQTTGGLLLALAAAGLWEMARDRRLSSWLTTRSVALGFAGGLLLAFPDRMLAAATAVTAGVLAASGLIEVFTTPPRAAVRADHERDPVANLLGWIRRRPDVAEDRATLQEKLYFEGPQSPVRFARFIALMVFASVIAAVGVVVESTAVVIGAMLIAPLMVPLMGTAFSVAMGWPRRLGRSAAVALTGIAIGIAVGVLVGGVGPRRVDVTTNAEILARISPTTVDLAIAVAAGAAGAYAMARRDVSDSLPGVAVAIALVPPLTVVGLCWQQGEWAAGNGALLLFLTNAAAILLAGGATFVLVGAAPLERVSESQRRLSTVVLGLLTVAGLIVALLVLNGAELARADLSRANVDRVLDAWVDDHEDFRVIDRRVLADGTFVVDLAGPSRPPNLEGLVADLRSELDDRTDLTVTWIPQRQVTVPGDSGAG